MEDQTVQSTMLLAVYGRAKASRLFPDILRDEEAMRIVESADYDFTSIDKTYGTEYASLCCLLRAKRFDDRCLAYIKKHPNGTVVNLGSGLDTTLSRVDNGAIRWYNIDLPDGMAFRRQFIPPSERCADIAKSMFDYTWLDEIGISDNSVLVLAGGLFYYFEEKQVRELFCRVAEHFQSGEVFFDAQSKLAVSVSNQLVRRTGNKGAQMHFFVNAPQKLREWSPSICKVESVPFFEGLWKESRFKSSTKFNMWCMEKLKMGSMVSIQWMAAN
ncbi:MAG: class I SAM-dependent methyltransferase [Clostridiales bacterium]|nr:class I SAM-dependent methyltransferase [Clostridiales bacterium]